MPEITHERTGQLLKAALAALAANDGQLGSSDVVARVGETIDPPFTPHELARLEKTKQIRWQALLHTQSVLLQKAGWLRKDGGIWYLTDGGREALQLDPADLYETAVSKYQDWQRQRQTRADPQLLETAREAHHFWGIHAGRTGDADELFLKSGVMAIGWASLGDPSRFGTDQEALKAALAASYPDIKPAGIPISAAQIFKFIHRIRINDLVVYPSKIGIVHIGRVTGEYRHDPAASAGYPNQRAVTWLKAVPRSALSIPAQREISANPSLFQIKNNTLEFQGILGSSTQPASARRSWIFQANPAYYDIDASIRELREMTWLVTSHRAEINSGDRVFIWRAGPSAAIVATATTTSQPIDIEEEPAMRRYVRDAEKFEGIKLRTRLRIDRALDAPITKAAVKAVPDLQRLQILAAPQGTNFPVTEGEALALEAMLDGGVESGAGDPSELVQAAQRDFDSAGLLFDESDLHRLAAALLAKRFVILSGLSGSGKTRIAQAFAAWLDNDRALTGSALIAVGPDWTSTDSALGYLNALDTSQYKRTALLNLLLRADGDPTKPYFLLLDEMNLSHVERYFADVLSAMESGGKIHLHDMKAPVGGVPPEFDFPQNVFVVGTVNVDETTYMFSPKVLDRANVLEFRSGPAKLQSYLANPRPVTISKLSGGGARFARVLLARAASEPELPSDVREMAQLELLMFYEVLAEFGLEFAFRTAREVLRFVAFHRELGGAGWELDTALDAQVVQKLLPRLHGSRQRLEPVLTALGILCHRPRTWDTGDPLAPQLLNRAELLEAAKEGSGVSGGEPEDISEAKYPLEDASFPVSFEKIRRMLDNVQRNGFTSFAEA
jgi:hypothetical protein